MSQPSHHNDISFWFKGMVSCYTTERFRKSLILINQVLTDALKSNMYESDAMSPCGFLQQKACILKAENHRFAPSHQQSLWTKVSRKSCTSEVVDTYTSWTTSSSYYIISYQNHTPVSYHHHIIITLRFLNLFPWVSPNFYKRSCVDLDIGGPKWRKSLVEVGGDQVSLMTEPTHEDLGVFTYIILEIPAF